MRGSNINPITGGLSGVRLLVVVVVVVVVVGVGVGWGGGRFGLPQISRTNRPISMGQTPSDFSHRELSESL